MNELSAQCMIIPQKLQNEKSVRGSKTEVKLTLDLAQHQEMINNEYDNQVVVLSSPRRKVLVGIYP